MSEPFLAQIIMFGGNFAPRGWALCDGQILAINSNQSLFSLLGTTYGGDGRTSFGLPRMRGRAVIGDCGGTGPGLTRRTLGQIGGVEENTLSTANLAPHSHTVQTALRAIDDNGSTEEANGNTLANSAVATANLYSNAAVDETMAAGAATTTVGNMGSAIPVNNMMPYLAVNYIIALQGLFPSRN